MSTREVSKNEETKGTSVADLDTKLEIVVIPVSDIDRAKEFYSGLGWRLDADHDNGSDFRIIQFTPPGSGCSVIFGGTSRGRAGFGPGPIPDCVRHQGRSQRSAPSRR